MSIFFIRHSESEGNLENKIDPGINSRLSEDANFYIKATKSELFKICNKFEIVISSPAIRTHETASRLFIDHPISISEKIIEFNFGSMANKKKCELNWKNHIDTCMINGESVMDVFDRSLSFFKSLDQNKNIAVVTHGVIIASILHYLNNISLDKFPLYEIDYCGFVHIYQTKLNKTFGIREFK